MPPWSLFIYHKIVVVSISLPEEIHTTPPKNLEIKKIAPHVCFKETTSLMM